MKNSIFLIKIMFFGVIVLLDSCKENTGRMVNEEYASIPIIVRNRQVYEKIIRNDIVDSVRFYQRAPSVIINKELGSNINIERVTFGSDKPEDRLCIYNERLNTFNNTELEIEYQKFKHLKIGYKNEYVAFFSKYLIGVISNKKTMSAKKNTLSRADTVKTEVNTINHAFYIHWVNINKVFDNAYKDDVGNRNKYKIYDYYVDDYGINIPWCISEYTIYIESNLPEDEIRRLYPNTNATFRQRLVDSIVIDVNPKVFSRADPRNPNPKFYYRDSK